MEGRNLFVAVRLNRGRGLFGAVEKIGVIRIKTCFKIKVSRRDRSGAPVRAPLLRKKRVS